MNLRNNHGVVALPEGLVREATAPEHLVVVWSQRPLTTLFERLESSGHLALRLRPEETLDMLSVSGPPAALIVDVALVDEDVFGVLEQVRAVGRGLTRFVMLAEETADASFLLRTMRAGLTEILDPEAPEAISALLPVNQQGQEPVLAVGAHPDDVEIGCGATLLRHRAAGQPVTVLTLSRGAVGGPREQRRREAAAASMTLGADLLMADLPDTQMASSPEMVTLIEETIALVGPTTVYVHSAHDNHQDHRAVHEATVIAARRVPQLYCYQSPSSRNGFAPTKFVPVSDTIDGKVEMLGHYASQATRHYLDPELVLATARYWARQLPAERYVEPFEVLRSE